MVVTLEFLNEQNSLKYPRSTTLGCKDKGRKSAFAAKTQNSTTITEAAILRFILSFL